MNIDEAIKIAKSEVKDMNALAYLNAIPRAIDEYGSDGFETQLLYAVSNMGTWRGETAREVKATMKMWIRNYNLKRKRRSLQKTQILTSFAR